MQHWVAGAKDRSGYLERLGAERVESLKVRKHAYAARADFGH